MTGSAACARPGGDAQALDPGADAARVLGGGAGRVGARGVAAGVGVAGMGGADGVLCAAGGRPVAVAGAPGGRRLAGRPGGQRRAPPRLHRRGGDHRLDGASDAASAAGGRGDADRGHRRGREALSGDRRSGGVAWDVAAAASPWVAETEWAAIRGRHWPITSPAPSPDTNACAQSTSAVGAVTRPYLPSHPVLGTDVTSATGRCQRLAPNRPPFTVGAWLSVECSSTSMASW